MCDPSTAPAEARAPDATREGPESPDLMPQWLAMLVAVVILFVLRRLLSLRGRRNSRAGTGLADREVPGPDAPRAPTASIHRRSADAAVRARRQRDDALEDADHPELSRALAALLDAVQWPEGNTPPEVSDMPGEAIAAARKAVSPAASHGVMNAARFTPAAARHAAPPGLWRCIIARAGTGPPAASHWQSCCA